MADDITGKAAAELKANAERAQAMTQKVVEGGTAAIKANAERAQAMTHSAMEGGSAMMKANAERAQAMTHTAMEGGAAAMKEFTKMFSEMKVPGMLDMEGLMSAQRRNLETLSAANRVALEGAQTVARRNMEIMQQTMSELTDTMRSFSSTDAPQTRAAKQAEMLKAAYERAVSNMQEISHLIQQSNGEALGLLNKRFAEAMDEVKGLVERSGRAKA